MKKNILYRIRVVIAVLAAVLAAAAFAGLFYPLRILDLQFGALIQRIFVDFSAVALVWLAFILLATLFFGRLYCSALCPLGILQEFIGIFKKGNSGKQKNYFFKYIIAAVVFGALAGGTVYLLRLAEPYTYFGSAFTLSLTGIIAVAAIIALVFVKDRFFCTNICPVGTVLGLISKVSVNKIYLKKDDCVKCGQCEKICPSGCINLEDKSVDNETCIKCLKCLNACKWNAVKYGAERDPEKVPQFSPKRRMLLAGAATAAVFAAAAKAGNLIKKASAENFSDVILPPGAFNEERFVNTCLNCNLCVKVCPTRIIKKADKNFKAVSIDYSSGICEFTCNDCSKACPAGALKKLSLEEKQRTRIGMISPPQKRSDAAVNACPTKALTLNGGGKPLFSATKCIGCGACKAADPEAGIAVYGTFEQKTL